MAGKVFRYFTKQDGRQRFVVMLAHFAQGTGCGYDHQVCDFSAESLLIEELDDPCGELIFSGLAMVWIG
jgi:hypothetical protein